MARFASTILASLVAVAASLTAQTKAPAGDWPQWRGPNRDGRSSETGLLRQWPPAGPKLIWSISNVGEGWGSVAAVGDRIFLQGAATGKSLVFSLRRTDGRQLWSAAIGASGGRPQGNGPGGTPTVDGDRAYVLTEMGDLACLRSADGSIVWQKNIASEFGATPPTYLWAESPLVDGDRLYITPGGTAAGLVALDKMTGKLVWATKELNDEASYSSIVVGNVQGVRTLTTLTASAAVGVRAADGKLMWRYPQGGGIGSISSPILFGDKVFYAWYTGAAVLGLGPQNGEVKANEIYFTKNLTIDHGGGEVLLNGYIYGFNDSILTCLNVETGQLMWRHRTIGKGSLTYADGRLYLTSEDNVVGLAEVGPSGYRETGRFTTPDQGKSAWAHPVVAGGRLYLRNQATLSAYDIKAR